MKRKRNTLLFPFLAFVNIKDAIISHGSTYERNHSILVDKAKSRKLDMCEVTMNALVSTLIHSVGGGRNIDPNYTLSMCDHTWFTCDKHTHTHTIKRQISHSFVSFIFLLFFLPKCKSIHMGTWQMLFRHTCDENIVDVLTWRKMVLSYHGTVKLFRTTEKKILSLHWTRSHFSHRFIIYT